MTRQARRQDLESDDLKRVGLKVTAPRVKVLKMLEEHEHSHLTAEDLYRLLLDAGEEMALATVYRVLSQFETAGLVARHHFESGQSIFELEHGRHHDHILCVKCGRVDEFVDETIEQLQREIAARAGYEMTDHALYIHGICAECRKDK